MKNEIIDKIVERFKKQFYWLDNIPAYNIENSPPLDDEIEDFLRTELEALVLGEEGVNPEADRLAECVKTYLETVEGVMSHFPPNSISHRLFGEWLKLEKALSQYKSRRTNGQ